MELRPMTMEDADRMLEWKNDPVTRQFAIATHAPINRNNHYDWLAAHVGQFRVMVKHGGEVAGAIRIDENYEVSIWVDSKWRKHGIATWILQHHAQRGMTARIVDGNIASMRAFIRAGFLPVSYHEEYEAIGLDSDMPPTAEMKRTTGYYKLQK